jgi:hypothetical protein
MLPVVNPLTGVTAGWRPAGQQPAAVPARPRWPSTQLGWLPLLSLTAASALWLISTANFLSRSTLGGGQPALWAGLVLLVAPVALRLAAPAAARGERIGLVVLLGLSLYLVKYLNSSAGFTFADEFVHLYNTEAVLQTGRLFSPNAVLPVTAYYPGLASVAAALAGLTGWPLFQVGLVIIGAARLIMMLALFLLYEQVSGSSRAAGLAALIYTANSNFVFFNASFSYESLALPLVMVALFAVARREYCAALSQRIGLTLVAALATCGVIMTHHLSAYFLVAFLCLWELALWIIPYLAAAWGEVPLLRAAPGWLSFYAGPRGLALFALLGTLAWLGLVAPYTITYLTPVFRGALQSLAAWFVNGSAGRELFRSSTGEVSPLWERAVGIGSVILCLAGLPFGLRTLWQRHRHTVLAWILGASAVGYFATLPLRLVPQAWETGNRASALMFIGLAFVLALAGLELWQPRRLRGLGQALFAGAAVIVFCGGLIAGWAPQLRLAHPYEVAVGNRILEPPGLSVARWSASMLGPGNRFGADVANCRYLLAYGMQSPVCGSEWQMNLLLNAKAIGPGQLQLIRDTGLLYILVDRRLLSRDDMAGYYFDQTGGGPLPASALYPPQVYLKFDGQGQVSRLLDSGDIVLYDEKAVVRDVASLK